MQIRYIDTETAIVTMAAEDYQLEGGGLLMRGNRSTEVSTEAKSLKLLY